MRQIRREELAEWIVEETADLLVINKPGDVVCHPSKEGPWSSLIGACREYTGLPVLHMPSRLDRETSGVVVFAKTHEWGVRLQKAIQGRRVGKRYVAVLRGRLEGRVEVEQPLGKVEGALVWVRQGVREDGSPAETVFEPLAVSGEHTLARVEPRTGRMHQIRAHAQWMGYPLVGDKIYGADERWFLRFLEEGMTEEMERELGFARQALHAAEIDYGDGRVYRAPVAPDLRGLIGRLGLEAGLSRDTMA